MVAELDVWPRAGEQGLHPRDEVVVRGLADQVAPAVAAVQLHRQLQRSREALVAAREDERLQLRRDLHDGLGATLAGLRLQVETAQDLCDQPDVDRLLGSAATGWRRRWPRCARSPTGSARRARRARARARPVRARRPRPGSRPRGRGRHRRARPAALRRRGRAAPHRRRGAGQRRTTLARPPGVLRVRDGRHVELEVSDDGVGLGGATATTAGSGLGLASMRQRAEEVGGTLEVLTSDSGTTVHALLPHAVGDLR